MRWKIMMKQIKKKKIITVIAAVLLVLTYVMIFSFSADDADASSAVSLKVTEFLKTFWAHFFAGGAHPAADPAAADNAESIVRKLAHFSEYMLLGFLSFGIAVMWIESVKKGFGIVIVQVIISAGLDEIHQYFVPGRHTSIIDVMIDTAGGIAGILIILCVKMIKAARERP